MQQRALFAVLVFAGIVGAMRKPAKRTLRPVKNPPEFVRMRKIIRAEAIRQGVPVELAMATARVESNFDPNAEGDKNWHLNTVRFEREVPKNNPFRARPELWHSYGLFQLLAPYYVLPGEDPRVLLDPEINAKRGVRILKRLMHTHLGDPNKVRLHYTNADAADATTQNRVLSQWQHALQTERELLA